MNEAKFDALEEYRTSPLFTDAERAALDYVTELTKNRTVNPETFARLGPILFRARNLRDRLACRKPAANIGLNIHSDMLCDITKKNKSR